MSIHPLSHSVRLLEQAVEEALHPKGMSTNGPCYVRLEASHATRILNHMLEVVTAPGDERAEELGIKKEQIVKTWNAFAPAAGFARVTKITGSRNRAMSAALKDYPSLAKWIRAIKAYVADAKRWPERVRFGFDTFIRPGQRDKWFDASPIADPSSMDEGEADAYYTKDMR